MQSTLELAGGSLKSRGETCRQLRPRQQIGIETIGRRAVGIPSIHHGLTIGDFFSELGPVSVDWRKTARQPTGSVNRTRTQTARTDAHSVSQHTLNRMITCHHANTRGSRAHIFVSQSSCHTRVMSRSLPHLTLTTSTRALSLTSPVFPSFPPSHPSPVVHDPYLPCEDPRQGGGSTQIPSPTGYDPKVIELEDLEPRRIELGDYYQNPLAEHMEEFGKVGGETSYLLQSQMHSECDSAESIADSDLEDGELRNMLASPLFLREREDNSGSSRRPTASGNQKQWQYRREGQVHNVLKLITQEEKA